MLDTVLNFRKWSCDLLECSLHCHIFETSSLQNLWGVASSVSYLALVNRHLQTKRNTKAFDSKYAHRHLIWKHIYVSSYNCLQSKFLAHTYHLLRIACLGPVHSPILFLGRRNLCHGIKLLWAVKDSYLCTFNKQAWVRWETFLLQICWIFCGLKWLLYPLISSHQKVNLNKPMILKN